MKTVLFKDVMHFYLGCELLVVKTKDVVTLDDIQASNRYKAWTRNKSYCSKYNCVGRGFSMKDIKPILRPISSMTLKECRELYDVSITELFYLEIVKKISQSSFNFWKQFAEYCENRQLKDFFDKGFDLFGLIESGEAIEKRKPKYLGTGIHVHSQPFDYLVEGDTFNDADFGDMIYDGKKWKSKK